MPSPRAAMRYAVTVTGLAPLSVSIRTEPAIASTTTRIRAVATEVAVQHEGLRLGLITAFLRVKKLRSMGRQIALDCLTFKNASMRGFTTSLRPRSKPEAVAKRPCAASNTPCLA